MVPKQKIMLAKPEIMLKSILSAVFRVVSYSDKINVHMAADGVKVWVNKSKGHSRLVRWKPTRLFAVSFSCPASEIYLEKS